MVSSESDSPSFLTRKFFLTVSSSVSSPNATTALSGLRRMIPHLVAA